MLVDDNSLVKEGNQMTNTNPFSHLSNIGNTSLVEDIGLRVKYINPKYPAQFDNFTIILIQKDYRGELCYRIVGDKDKSQFGCVAHLDEVEIICK